MAHKDWKKDGENDWFHKVKDRRITIIKDMEKGVIEPWRVQFYQGSSGFYTSWIGFKTKQQALKYARAYMRKH